MSIYSGENFSYLMGKFLTRLGFPVSVDDSVEENPNLIEAWKGLLSKYNLAFFNYPRPSVHALTPPLLIEWGNTLADTSYLDVRSQQTVIDNKASLQERRDTLAISLGNHIRLESIEASLQKIRNQLGPALGAGGVLMFIDPVTRADIVARATQKANRKLGRIPALSNNPLNK